MVRYNVKKFYVPMKKRFPTLPYDIAIHCRNLIDAHPYPFPSYLESFHEMLSAYAAQVDEVMPKRFPKGYRIYVIDQRLHVPLIIHDDEIGRIKDFCYDLAKGFRPMEEYIFGDGAKLEVAFDYSVFADPNAAAVGNFIQQYGFLPFEEFAMPTLLMFYKDECKVLMLSSWQVNLLMEKYREQNLVDMAEHVKLLFDPYAC